MKKLIIIAIAFFVSYNIQGSPQSKNEILVIKGEAEYSGSILPLEIFISKRGEFLSIIGGWVNQITGFDGKKLWRIDDGVGPVEISFLEKELLQLLHLGIVNSCAGFKGINLTNEYTSLDQGKLKMKTRMSNQTLKLVASNSPGYEKIIFSESISNGLLKIPKQIKIEWDFELSAYTLNSITYDFITHDIFDPPKYRATGSTFRSGKSGQLETRWSDSGNFFIKPKIEGKDYGWFLFDSGAGISLLSTEISDLLNFDAIGEAKVSGVGGSLGNKNIRVGKNIEIGPLKIDSLRFFEYDPAKSKASKMIDEPVIGVIGWDLLLRSILDVNTRDGSIKIYEPGKYKVDPKMTKELFLHWNVPFIEATFESKDGIFMLDTGAGNKGIIFHFSAVKRFSLLERKALKERRVIGAGGIVNAKIGTIDRFQITNEKMYNVPAIFISSEDGEADLFTTGFLGTKAINSDRIVFDYANNTVGFLPIYKKE